MGKVNNRVIITGGSGFIGHHLTTFLVQQGYEVTVFDLRKPRVDAPCKFIKGNILDKERVTTAIGGHDYVIHLASLLGTSELINCPFEATLTNIGGTIHVLEACRRFRVKLIEVSKPNCWLNTYTITKVAAENFVQMYEREFGVKAVIVRPFNVYGPGQPTLDQAGYQKAVPTWIVNGFSHQPIKIYGDGQQTMDLIHTLDVSRAIATILANWQLCQGKALDIGSGVETSVNELAAMIAKTIYAHSSLISHIPMRPGETEHTSIKGDISELAGLTGWRPRVPLEAGLRETVEWYHKQQEVLAKTKFSQLLVFMPVYNTGYWVKDNLPEFLRFRQELAKQGTSLLLHLVTMLVAIRPRRY